MTINTIGVDLVMDGMIEVKQKPTVLSANLADNKDLSMEECADIIASLGGQKRNVAIQRVALAFGSKGKRKDEEKEILRNKDIDNRKIRNWIISRSNDANEITQNKVRKIASAHTAQKLSEEVVNVTAESTPKGAEADITSCDADGFSKSVPAIYNQSYFTDEKSFNLERGMVRSVSANYAGAVSTGFTEPGIGSNSGHEYTMSSRTVFIAVSEVRKKIKQRLSAGEICTLIFYEEPDPIANKMEALARALLSTIRENTAQIHRDLTAFSVHILVKDDYPASRTLVVKKEGYYFDGEVYEGIKVIKKTADSDAPVFKILFKNVKSLEEFASMQTSNNTTDQALENVTISAEGFTEDEQIQQEQGILSVKKALTTIKANNDLESFLKLDRKKRLRTENYDHKNTPV